MLNNSDKYPSTLAYGYVWNYLNSKGVTEEDIGKLAMGLQKKFLPEVPLEKYISATLEISKKWDILNCCMVGIALDKAASNKQLDEPLQTIMDEDLGVFAVDEVLAYYGFATLYGGIGITSAGWLDKEKTGIIAKLDKDNTSVNVFLDDLIVGLVACVSAKIAHDYTEVE